MQGRLDRFLLSTEQSTQVVVRPEMSTPKHRMGCPSTTQEFYNGAWYPLKGYLTQGNTESVMDSEKVTTCGISEPDSLPAGKYYAIIVQTLDSGEFNYSVEYCCSTKGDADTPVTFPAWDGPFYLLPSDRKCQKVEGMDVRRQFLLFRASVLSGFVESSPVNFTNVRTNANKSTITFDVCKYQPSSHVANAPGSEKSKLEIGSLLKMALDMDAQLAIYDRLIHPDKMETLGQIGKGAFGTVYQGRYRPDNNPLHAQYVAIKNIKESCTYPEIKAFMEEAIVMAGFRHANVLTMIGVCVHPITHIPTLILPFMEHGDLQKYLRKFRYEDDLKNMTPELHQLLSFCLHIARGMTYLSDMKFVHRDLAARNCMLDSNMVVRVADFGLTRDIYSDSYYRQDKNKLLPIKWMALESLRDRVFNFQTDVWSFGVTVWEIFTLGKVPYPELENIQVLPELERGQRLPKPDTCPVAVHDMVLKCWLENPKERPSFVDIVKSIEANLGEMSEYLDLDKGSENTTGVTDGIVSSHQELAEISNLTARAKMGYDDYREPRLDFKLFHTPKFNTRLSHITIQRDSPGAICGDIGGDSMRVLYYFALPVSLIVVAYQWTNMEDGYKQDAIGLD
ncbi:tyrosine-protein kinase receptor TYRO3-like [Liolophura sinensis]|uniref:tyrosine-protein kinase receptor TYRO3-like n=1 Tax=Liolophura sinensis TaxID=3198878 RepID=UPI0031593961